jgi:hypothetical protein
MPTPEGSPSPQADWRAWLVLAWVVCFGLMYARVAIEQRGGRIRAAMARLVSTWSPADAPRR